MKKAFVVASVMVCLSPAFAEGTDSKIQYQGTPKYLTVSGISVRASGKLLELQLEFKNTSRSEQQGFYRMVWLDESGFSVWGEEPWKPILLYGNQTQLIQVLAPTAGAKDFKIQFNAEANTSASVF